MTEPILSTRGGGLPGLRLRGEDRARALAQARAWREAMAPVFDRMDAAGAFSDSPGSAER